MGSKWIKRFFVVLALATALAVAAIWVTVETINAPPRRLGPYLERRAAGHNPLIVGFGNAAGTVLMNLDRGIDFPPLPKDFRIGARPTAALPAARTSRPILVASVDEAARAIANAAPGDAITFLPGTYRLQRRTIKANRPGAEAMPITVRAERSNTVYLEIDTTEGIVVSAPYWTFENLNITGVCKDHSACEHAFHVVGDGRHFTARNNVITDFNAHFKINALNRNFPDHGTIEGNTLSNSSVRHTANPVTPVDLVAASHWTVRRNLIADFAKAQGDGISYGAFVKGAGEQNRMEQNVVLCEMRVRNTSGQRVGLSLGGGGTGKDFCRDGKCITEQQKSVIQSNLIANCSDDGIYINKSAESRVLHNTLIDTGGISVRFPQSSADVEGNLIDGAIRVRDDAVMRAVDNYDTGMLSLYFGRHPVRSLFSLEPSSPFAWTDKAPRRQSEQPDLPDLCGLKRPLQAAYGAFEDFTACRL